MSNAKTLQNQIVKELKKVAKALGKPEANVSQAQFLANSEVEFTEWEIRKAGGFSAVKNMFFQKEENIVAKHGSSIIRSHKNKLEKEYATEIFMKEEILSVLEEVLQKNPIRMHKPLKATKKKKTKKSRTLVAHVSDTHFGNNIEANEMNGSNEFSWKQASRRMALFAEQIAGYKPHYREDTELVIQINGDIIAGQIHNQEWFVDLLTKQVVGTMDILNQFISYLATKFPSVRVVCTSGNHGRNVGKADKGRATTHKWDSYETIIYCSVRNTMEAVHKNVTFEIPESPFALYQVQGHWVLQTHGDTVINVGNVGNSLNMKGINEQVNNFNASDMIKFGEKVAVVSVGHVHVPTAQLLQNGCMLMVNGCLSGTDPFAQSIGIFSNNPTQTIFESTKEHAVGDMRLIQVKEADDQARLDSIIAPFKGNF